MKKTLMMAAAAAFLVGGMATSAMAGGAFCKTCHKGTKDAVGPSLTSVVAAYGSVDAVFAFLDSDADLDPKVAAFAGKKNVMKGQLKKYRKLSAEKKADVRHWFEGELK